MHLLSKYKLRVLVPPYRHQARYRSSNEGKNVNITYVFLLRAHLHIFTIVSSTCYRYSFNYVNFIL
jgi:hypothetical protein